MGRVDNSESIRAWLVPVKSKAGYQGLRPLTKRERILRDMLTARLEVAAYDAPLQDFENRLDAGEIKEDE